MRFLGVVLCALAVHATARAEDSAPEVFAVVVGHNGAAPGLPTLRFADDDAVRFALLLRGLARDRGSGRVWVLTQLDDDTRSTLTRAGLDVQVDGPPTRTAFARAFQELGQAVARPAPPSGRLLYVIYAGHGLGDRVVLQPEVGDQAALTGRELRSRIGEVTAKDSSLRAFLFVDACRAQSLFGERGGGLAEEIQSVDDRADAAPLGVLAASASSKPATEVASLHAGLFSYVLASALAGAADADGDDVISFAEVAAFVAWGTRRLTGQMPWFEPPAGRLDAATADHRGTRTRVVTRPRGSIHLRIEDATGRPLFAEAYKEGPRAMRLALPPGRYRVWRDGPRGSQVAHVALALAQTVTLDDDSWVDHAAPTAARGDDPDSVLDAPFGPGAVAALEAGWRSGRERSSTAPSRVWTAMLGAGVSSAPLDLGGVEPLAAFALRLMGRGPSFGLRARAASASHDSASGPYDLRRASLFPSIGWGFAIGSFAGLEPYLGAGFERVWRQAPGSTTRGDPFSPLIVAGLALDLRIARPWFIGLEGESAWQWIDVEGIARTNHGLRAALGVGARW